MWWNWLSLGLITILYYCALCHGTTTRYATFYVSYIDIWGDGIPSLLLMTTETQPVSYMIEAPAIQFYQNGTMVNGAEVVVNFPQEVIVSLFTNATKGIYVTTSSYEVTVIGQNLVETPNYVSADTFFVLPFISSCDNVFVYYRMSVDSNSRVSMILLIGIENDTTVTVFPYYDILVRAEGVMRHVIGHAEYTFNLSRLNTAIMGDSYASDFNVAGIKVVTNKPVAVFSGHNCAVIPNNFAGCDYLIEQIPPTSLWGRVYYTAPLATRRSYTIKILATFNFTVVDIYCNNSKESNSIGDGEIIKRTYSYQEHCAIYSNKEVFVAQFSHGQNDDNVTGDPMMTTVPATIHYTNKFLFSTIHYPNYSHYVNIIVLAQYHQPDMMYVKSGGVNKSLDTLDYYWAPIKVNDVIEAYATYVTISKGVVEVIHTNKLALMTTIVYGFARYKGYGHPGGFCIQKLHDPTVIPPSISITATGNRTVGQPLALECTAIDVDCGTASAEFVWSTGGIQLKQIEGTDICFRYGNSSVCTDTYNISALSTSDDDSAYDCDIVIYHSPPVTASGSISLNLDVPTPFITTYAHASTMVGFTQLVGCRATTVRGVELNAVQFSWMGPTGNTLINNTRVAILPKRQHQNNFSSEVLFDYLREGDQGVYTCTVVILNARVSASLNTLPILKPQVTIEALGPQTAGQPLTLACHVIVSRSIISSVDITWSRDGTILSMTIGAIGVNLLYTSYYNISLLTTNDTGKVYECDVVINSSPPVVQNETFELKVNVSKVPLSVSQSTNYPVSGQPYNLTCTAAAYFVPPSLIMLNWVEYGSSSQYMEIPQSSRVMLSDLITNGSQIMRTVTFLPLLRSDAGEYLCTVVVLGNTDAYNTHHVVISANVPTVTANISPTLFTGDSGEDAVELLCTVVVMEDIIKALYQFAWTKDGNSLDLSHNRIQITNSNALSSSFYIDSADANALLDNGVYTCYVRVTIAGVDSFVYSSGQSVVSLRVHNNFRAVNIKSTSIVFQWDAPAFVVVSQYSIMCTNMEYSFTVIISSTSTNGTVTGLTPFTTYNCSIVLYTRSTTSGYPITVRTAETVSSPPIITSVVAVDTHSVRVDWMIPNRVNGIITYYTITYTTDNGMENDNIVFFNGQPMQYYIITGLSHPYQLVTVTINATNGGGTSNSSNVVTGRTAEAVPGIVKIYNTTSFPDGTSAAIVWYQPKQPNGIITGYQLIYSVYNDSAMIMTSNVPVNSTRKHIIKNLTPGVPYQVQVVAFTSVGRGALNDYVTFFSKELYPLKSPENVNVIRLRMSSINVTWDPVSLFEARGFPKYTVVLYVGNFTEKVSTETIETSNVFAVFKHLQAGTVYTMVVSVATDGSTTPLQSSPIIVPIVDAESEGGGSQSVDGLLIGGVIGGLLVVSIVAVTVSLFLWYRSRKRGSFQPLPIIQMQHLTSSNEHVSQKKSVILLNQMDDEL